MTHDDGWRRRLAQERYGDSLTPGFAREGATGPRDAIGGSRSSDDTAAMYFRGPSAAAFGPSTPLPGRLPAAGRFASLGWAVAALLAIVIAGGVGWFVRGGQPRIIYLPWGSPASTATPPTAPLPESAIEPAPGTLLPPLPTLPSSGDVKAPDAASSPPAVTTPPAKTGSAPKQSGTRHRAVSPQMPSVATFTPPIGPLPATGYPCVNGSGPASRTLCDSVTLRRFDEQMQVAQAEVVAHGDKQLIALAAKDRIVFLRHREKCADIACLTRVYTDRIVALVKLLPAGAATPPICQPEQYTHTPLMNCWPWRLRETRKPFYSK